MALTIATNKNWSDYEANSTTSLVIGSGALTALTLTIETGKAYSVGDDIALVPTAKIPMMLIGTVTSYDSGTGALEVNCNRIESAISSRDLNSSTSNTIGTGTKTFQTYNGKSALLAASDAIMVGRLGTNGGNRMVGTVTSYDNANGTLVTSIASTIGSGTSQTDWIIVSSGTFSAWKIIPSPVTNIDLLTTATLTTDMEPSYPVGSFRSLDRGRYHVNNPSTTTPWVIEVGTKNVNSTKLFDLFTSGAYDVTGARIVVKTGDGTAGQTIDYSASPLTKIDWPAIEVETGSGTGIYRPFYVALDNASPRGFSGKNGMNRGYSASFIAPTSGTVTLTTASPTVVSWAGNTLNPGDKFRHTTTGSVTGMTVGADYYVLHDSFVAGTSFKISVSPLGSPINVTAQSGTHTGYSIPALGSGDHGNFALFNPATRILTFGDGTRGNVIPNGAKVRIPNIYFQMDHPRTPLLTAYASGASGSGTVLALGRAGNLFSGTAQVYYINGEEITATISGNNMTTVARALSGTGAQDHAQGDTVYGSIFSSTNRAATDAADGGKCTWNGCAFGLGVYPYIANPQTSNFTDVWAVGGFRVDNSTADCFADGVFSSPHPCGDGGITFSSILGGTSVNRIYGATTASVLNAGPNAVILQSLQNVTKAENLEGVALARNGTGTVAGVNLTACVTNAFVKNITTIGGRLTVSNSNRIEFDGIRHSAEANGIASANVASSAIALSNVQFGVYRNISTVVGGVGPRNQFFSTDANCADNTLHTIAMDGTSNASAIISPSGNTTRVARGTFGTFRDAGGNTSGTGALTNTATGDTVIIRDCQFTPGDSYGADNGNGSTIRVFLEQTTGHSMWWRNSPNPFNGNYQECGPFHVLLDVGTKATGTLFAQFSVKANRDIYDLGGDAYVDNGGTVVLPTAGDYIILKSYQILRTITGFTGVSVQDVNNANLVYEFELVGHEGVFTGTFAPLTSTDLNASIAAIIGYSDAKGLKIRLKITATATDTTNKVINVRMLTTNNAATLLPIGSTNYTLTDIVPGTTIAAYAGSEEVAYIASASGSVTVSLPYEFDGLMASVTMKIRKQNYSWDGHIATYNQYAFSRASQQDIDIEVTESNISTIAAYTSFTTKGQVYDYSKYWGTLRSNLLIPKTCYKSDSYLDFGSYDIVIDPLAASVYSLVGNTITIKYTSVINFSIITTGTISFVNGASSTAWYRSSSGTSVIVSAPNVISGSRYQLWDDTNGIEIVNEVSSGTGIYYRMTWTSDITIRLRATYQNGTIAKHELLSQNILTSTGATFLDTQLDETVYNDNAIDGSTVTEFTSDYPNVQIDISDMDGYTTVQRIYAWYHYIITTADGIRNFFAGMEASDSANYKIIQSILNLKLDNVSATPVIVGGGYLARADGTTVIAATSNSIQMDPSKAYVAAASVTLMQIEGSTTLAKEATSQEIKNGVIGITGLVA